MFATLEKEGEHHLVETLSDVDGDVFNVVLDSCLSEGGEEIRHLAPIGVGDFVGLEFELAAALEVDEEVRPRIVIEVHLMGKVVGVEDDDFMFVVPEVAQGVEEILLSV